MSDWTVDTLKVMLDERYATQTKAVDAAFLAQQTAMQTALTAAERAVQTALLSAEKAVTKAEVAADKRFDLLNELRVGVATASQLEALEKIVGAVTARLDKLEARQLGVHEKTASVRASVLGAVAVATLVLGVIVFLASRGGG